MTNDSKPTLPLLFQEKDRDLSDRRQNIVEALSIPGLADIEFEPPCSRELPWPADLF